MDCGAGKSFQSENRFNLRILKTNMDFNRREVLHLRLYQKHTLYFSSFNNHTLKNMDLQPLLWD